MQGTNLQRTSIQRNSHDYCVEWDFFSYANLRIDARYLEVRNYSHENIKKIIVNYPVYTLTHRVRFCLRLKQRRRALTVNHIGYLRTFIHKGQVVTSVIAL